MNYNAQSFQIVLLSSWTERRYFNGKLFIGGGTHLPPLQMTLMIMDPSSKAYNIFLAGQESDSPAKHNPDIKAIGFLKLLLILKKTLLTLIY